MVYSGGGGKQRGGARGGEGRGANAAGPLSLQKEQESLADLVSAPKLWLCLRAAHYVLRWFPIIAECAGEHQWVRFRGGGPPPPPFPDLLQIKDLQARGFGSAHSKGVSGANLGSAHSKGFSGFWLLFTTNCMPDGDICQWLNGRERRKD